MWALLRNFSTTKYFEAAKAGVLDGIAPYAYGAIIALRTDAPADERAIFGDAAVGVSGFQLSHGVVGNVADQLGARAGTVLAVSGSDLNDGTAQADADATYALDPEGNFINREKSYLDPNVAVGADFSWPSPRMNQLIYLGVDVTAAGNMTVFCNGKIVSVQAVGNASNANPVRIGIDSTTALPFDNGMIAGCFYRSDAFADPLASFTAHWQACKQAQDVVQTSVYDALLVNWDFVWSVKRSRLWDGRTTWASFGAQASVDMVKQGATPLDVAGSDADVIAADMDWMTV